MEGPQKKKRKIMNARQSRAVAQESGGRTQKTGAETCRAVAFLWTKMWARCVGIIFYGLSSIFGESAEAFFFPYLITDLVFRFDFMGRSRGLVMSVETK